MQELAPDLSGPMALRFAVLAADEDLVSRAGQGAEQPPGPAEHPFDLRVEHDVVERADHLFDAQAATLAAGPAGVLAQFVTFDEKRIFGLDLLRRTVVGVPVIDADGRAH